MIKFNKNINGQLYKLNAESYLKEQAEALFKILSDIPVYKLKNGFKVQVGWNLFILLEDEEGFHIVVPDYTKNPFEEVTDDLTIALWVYLEQISLLRKINSDGEMISFQDKVLCAKGVLDLEDIYLERRDKNGKGNSGWYIGPVDDAVVVDEYEMYYAYQLLELKLEIIKVLALPIGYLAVFKKGELKAILNEEDVDLLNKVVK